MAPYSSSKSPKASRSQIDMKDVIYALFLNPEQVNKLESTSKVSFLSFQNQFGMSRLPETKPDKL